MNTMISIKENKKIHIDDSVHEFLNPDYLYIPILEDLALSVKTNSEIYKEQILLKGGGQYVYTPISGKVLGKTDSMKLNNKTIECIVIENDFKEKVNKKKGAIKYINEYTKEEMYERIRKYNACDELIYSYDALQPGDLVFFHTEGWNSHVGIYIGGGEFVHAGSPSTGIVRASLYNTYWRSVFFCGGRFY